MVSSPEAASQPHMHMMQVQKHERRPPTKKRSPPPQAEQAAQSGAVSKKKAQPTVRRVLKRHETLATLEDVTPKSRTKSTPDSTGKANFPHDLEHGSLIRRSGHISARRRRSLDGDMHHAGSSAQHGAELVD